MSGLATTHKRGDTFGRLATVLFDGTAVDLTGATITSQVRTPAGALIASLTIEVISAAAGQVEISSTSTSAWPLSNATSPLLCDIKIVDGDTNRTTTFEIHVVAQVTE
jgi:hypothetical protein